VSLRLSRGGGVRQDRRVGRCRRLAAAGPGGLAARAIDCAVILPLYRSARQSGRPLTRTGLTFQVPILDREVTGGIWRSTLPDSDVPVFLIEQNAYFDRDYAVQGRGLYQHTLPDGRKADYSDNCERFVFFSRAVLEAIRVLDFWPDILHLNDWQTGLIPVYLKELYPHYAQSALRPRYRHIRTLCTLHNLAYQGVFWHFDMPLTGLPWRLFNFEELEFYGHINFLKAGIVFSDLITTVSPTYAREIQTPYFGCGLQGVLAQRSKRLFGIVNGADYRVWDPATDELLAMRYNEATVEEGKAACKRALQKQYGLAEEPRTPLLGMVSRLVDQKGLDLVVPAAAELVKLGAQLVVLGQGDPKYEKLLTRLQKALPRQVAVTLAHDETLAHQIEAGADVFLMPSRYEPCGLSQLYSLKYGTVPLVRATGGLVDTVTDATPANLAAGTATGFSFIPYAPESLLETAGRALQLYREEPTTWRSLQRTGMRQDWSWARSAAEYDKLYQSLVHAPRPHA
jgi:starch synthase